RSPDLAARAEPHGRCTRGAATEHGARAERAVPARRRARLVWPRLSDHGLTGGAGAARTGQHELGRHLQHGVLDRPGERPRRGALDAVSALLRRSGDRHAARVRARRLRGLRRPLNPLVAGAASAPRLPRPSLRDPATLFVGAALAAILERKSRGWTAAPTASARVPRRREP